MADTNFNIKVGTQLNDTLQKQLDASPKKTITVKPILDTKGLQVGTKTVTQYAGALGEVTEATKKVYTNGKEMSNSISKVKSTVDTTSQTLQTASKHTKTLGQDFIDTAGKVAKFGAITAIFGLVTSAIGNAVKSVKELDDSLAELRKVSDLSGKGLKDYTDRAFSMARELSTTASNVTDASALFVQAGYSLSESEGLSKYAIMLQSIADDTMDVETASSFLTKTIKSMNLTVADAEHVISAVNQVSNEYAITSNELSENIGKVAGVANVAGVSYEQLIGLMTSAVSRGSEASKSANAFKTLFVNLQQMNQDGTMPKLEKQFNEFQISMIDANGATKDAFTLLNELSVAYKNVSNSTDVNKQNQMRTLLEDIAGKHNINVLINALEGFDIALSATETAMNSSGSAQKEFQKNLDAIQKKTEGLQGAFQELVWGDGGLNSFLKAILDAGTALLNFANSDIGGLIIKTTLLLSSFKLLSMGVTAFNTLLKTGSSVNIFIFALQAITQGAATTSEAIGFLTTTMLKSPLFWGAIAVAGIYTLVKVVKHFSVSLKEASESLSENKSIFDETVSTLKTLNDKLEETKDRMNEIENFKAPTLTDKEELNSLKEQNIELERQIALENERQLQASKKLADSASQTLNTKITSTQQIQIGESRDYDGKSTPVYGYSSEKVTPEEELQRSIDMYKKAEQAIIDLNTAYDNGELTLEQYEEQQLGLQQLQDSSRTRALEMVEITNASEQAYKGIIDSKGELKEAEQAEYDRIVLINGQYYIFIDAISSDYVSATETAAAAAAVAAVAAVAAAAATEAQVSSLSDYEKALKDLDATLSILSGTTISGLADAFSLLKDAQAEINDTGSLSIDTYESLMNLGAKYQAILFDENGQLRLNEESVTAVYNAKIDEMAVTSARDMVKLAGQLKTENKSFADLANSTNSATIAGWGQVAVMMAELELSEKDSKALQVRIDGIKQWAEEAKKNVGTYSKTTKAISTQTKAIDKQKEALDKLKDEYKAVTEYIEDQLDSEISRIEDAKSAELDRVDAIIDALNKRKDAELESIDFTIDALNKKRDVEEEYWDNRISALEEQNKATEKQIELEQLQQNLALARNKKVMVMGANGWEVREDESAVAQAEQDIADYTRKQQAQTEIDILNKLKETALANYTSQIQAQEEFRAQQESNYDSQIQTQEEFRARQEATYDSQIQVLEGYKTEYNNMVNAYEEEQNRLLALQVLGTDFENQTWQARLDNLQSYVNRYNNLQASLSGSVENTSSGSVKTVEKPSNVPTTKKITPAIGRGAITSTVRAYASGIASVPDDGMAVTGDNPNNRELVIGSKLNGTATMLSQGSGVVNAQSTKSLAGILNTLGSSMGLNGQTMGATTTNQSNATSQSIQIANITLPSVTNGQGLLDELRGFASGMLQTAYSNG